MSILGWPCSSLGGHVVHTPGGRCRYISAVKRCVELRRARCDEEKQLDYVARSFRVIDGSSVVSKIVQLHLRHLTLMFRNSSCLTVCQNV